MSQSKIKGIAPIAIILIIAGVLVLAGGGFYLYQKSNSKNQNTESPVQNQQQTAADETANWKTYKNDQYGFEVKYPSDWETKIFNVGGKYLFGVGFKPRNLTGETLANIFVSKEKLGLLAVQSEKQNNSLLFTLQNSGGSDYLNLEKKILSTFKFSQDQVSNKNNNLNEEQMNAIRQYRARAVFDITNLRGIALGLNLYYRNYKNYPKDLYSLINKDGNIETTVSLMVVGKDSDRQAEFFGKAQYKPSVDSQHYVLSTTLGLDKNLIDKVNNVPLEKTEGIIYGVNCSDPKIYCLTDSTQISGM